VRELHEKLLAEYLRPKTGTSHKSFLEELERDILQYRLLHRGYARYFAEQGGLRRDCENEMDTQSAFWDSGYRRLATTLFIKKVFLPQLR
jgi:hypothetical protein